MAACWHGGNPTMALLYAQGKWQGGTVALAALGPGGGWVLKADAELSAWAGRESWGGRAIDRMQTKKGLRAWMETERAPGVGRLALCEERLYWQGLGRGAGLWSVERIGGKIVLAESGSRGEGIWRRGTGVLLVWNWEGIRENPGALAEAWLSGGDLVWEGQMERRLAALGQRYAGPEGMALWLARR